MAFRSVAHLAYDTGSPASVPIPSGAQVGDIAVIGIGLEGEDTTSFTALDGFTVKTSEFFDGGSGQRIRHYILWKRLTTAATGSWTLEWTGGNGGRWGWSGLWSGRLDSGDPFTFVDLNAAQGTTPPSVSGTATAADDLVLDHLMWNAAALTGPGGYTERLDQGDTGVFTLDDAGAGPTGSLSVSGGGTTTRWTGLFGLAVEGATATDLDGADTTQAQAATAAALTQTHELDADATIQAQSATSAALTQTHALVADSATQAQQATAAAITQVHELQPTSAVQGQTAAAATLLQTHELAATDAMQAQTADAAAVAEGVTLSPSSTVQDQAATAAALSQVHELTAVDVLHVQSADAAALTQLHELLAASAAQSQLATTAAVTLGEITTPPDRTFDVLAENRNFSAPAEDRAFPIPVENRTFVAAESRRFRPHMTNETRISGGVKRKDPNDVLDYVWDWSAWLADGDTISTFSVIISDTADTPLVEDSSSNDDTSVTVWLSGGTIKTYPSVTVRIVTAQGRTADGTKQFQIEEL